MVRKRAGSMLILVTLSACAPTADSISPAYVDPAQFTKLTCKQMAQELALRDNELAKASAQEDRASSNDTLGVLLLGVPTASASGENISGTVARLKGEQVALRDAMIRASCSAEPEAPAPETTPSE